jgi:hypothetical protein
LFVSSGAGGARVSSMPPAGASYPPDTLRGQEGAGEPAADFGAVASTLHQIEQPDVHGRHPDMQKYTSWSRPLSISSAQTQTNTT